MALDVAAVRRWSRQLALPEIGPEGQERICAASALVVGQDAAADAAGLYLAAAGVGKLRTMARAAAGAPLGPEAWAQALGDVSVAVVASGAGGRAPPWRRALPSSPEPIAGGYGDPVRVPIPMAFADDPLLRMAIRAGVPVIVARAQRDQIDVLSFRKHGPCPHVALDADALPANEGARADARSSEDGALAVVAGTLAAAEALWVLARPGEAPRARHLRLALDLGALPLTQEIPWAPECFACGGQAREAVFP